MSKYNSMDPISVEHDGTFYRVSVRDIEEKPEAPFIIYIEDVLTGEQQSVDIKSTPRAEATALQDFCVMSWFMAWRDQQAGGTVIL
ncbi:hypothetical protein LCGC14_1290770 [marine sediment metagenome]|uniref:Uncharacterized protein n=1 Tax=marine sediment metagenome TaxID=412755 RepID=A0A0F9NVI3_9ZZZZ